LHLTPTRSHKQRHLRTLCLGLLSALLLLSTASVNARSTNPSQNPSSLKLFHSKLHARIFPAQHQIDVTALLHIKGKTRPTHLTLYLGQMPRINTLHIQRGTTWHPVPFKRALETARLTLPKGKSLSFTLRVRYKIVFFGRKNYLFRRIFCNIEKGNTYFLYGWYPSLQPFADPLRGQLIGKERFSYTLTIDVPKGETAIGAGTLIQTKSLPKGRTRFVYTSSSVPEAAIFIASGTYTRHVHTPTADTKVVFYLHHDVSIKRRKTLAKMVARTASFYRKMYGSPIPPTTKKRATKTWRWKLISFGGSGARGYPFSLLLDRTQGHFFADMKLSMDGMFTLGQVLLHEIAHTWWGNAVTGIDEGSTWLNEGLANYASLRAMGHLLSPQDERAAVRRHILYYLRGKDKGSLIGQGGIAQMAHRTPYTKGALVFYELARELGQGTLDRGLKRYFQRFRGSFATVKDLQRVLEKTSGRSLQTFFDNWIKGAALPFFTLVGKHCPPKKKVCTLTLRNHGDIPGHAHLLVQTNRRKLTKWIRVPAKKSVTLDVEGSQWNKVVLDPQGQMLHGVRWRATFARAYALRKEGSYQQAAAQYTKLLKAFPQHGRALYEMGRIKELGGKIDKAISYYKSASQQKRSAQTPGWIVPWSVFRQATLLYKQGKTARARQLLKALRKKALNYYNLHGRIDMTLQQWRSSR